MELDLDDDGNIDRIVHHAFAADGTRSLTRRDFDSDDDGTIDRSEAYTYNASGSLIRTDFDTDGDGSLDQVRYDGGIDFSGGFPDHAGLEVVQLGGDGSGDGGTDLTIPDNTVFAGASGARVRIEGGNTDTLRFDMDDFIEGDRVDFEGENYRSFTADDGTWSFTVDADVMLFDI